MRNRQLWTRELWEDAAARHLIIARGHKRSIRLTGCPASKFYEESMLSYHARQARDAVRAARGSRPT